MPLKKNEIEELKKQLEEKKIELTQDLKETMAEVASPDEQKGGAYGTHSADNDTTALYRDLGLSETERNIIREIDAALERIKAGTYGLSIESGEEIPFKRLKAIPWASRTAPEQERFEKMKSPVW